MEKNSSTVFGKTAEKNSFAVFRKTVGKIFFLILSFTRKAAGKKLPYRPAPSYNEV